MSTSFLTWKRFLFRKRQKLLLPFWNLLKGILSSLRQYGLYYVKSAWWGAIYSMKYQHACDMSTDGSKQGSEKLFTTWNRTMTLYQSVNLQSKGHTWTGGISQKMIISQKSKCLKATTCNLIRGVKWKYQWPVTWQGNWHEVTESGWTGMDIPSLMKHVHEVQGLHCRKSERHCSFTHSNRSHGWGSEMMHHVAG